LPPAASPLAAASGGVKARQRGLKESLGCGGGALSGGGSLGLVATWNLEVRRGMVLAWWRLLLTVWALDGACRQEGRHSDLPQ